MKGFLTGVFLFELFLFPAQAVFADSYAFYVDRGAESGGDGSSKNPFRKIDDALDEAKKGDKIFVKNGSYDGGFTIEEGVHLQGESESKVQIGGSVTMENGASLFGATVSGGYAGITVKSGAKVALENCTVKSFKKIGINILAGNGELEVKNCNLHSGLGKAFYIEKGNRIEISSSKIHGNDEEGIDIRQGVDGYISGNEIYGNGESGIEVVLGSADLSIKNNVIQDNGASGIASQYYEIAKKTGGVKIENNKIKDNGKFGIDCNIPQAGNPSDGYWSKSLDVGENDFEDNKKGRINSRCKLVEADQGDGGEEYDKSEESAVEVAEAQKETVQDKKKQQEEKLEQERLQEIEKKSQHLSSQLKEIEEEYVLGRARTDQVLKTMEKENFVWRFFWGSKSQNLKDLSEQQLVLEEKISELEGLALEASDSPLKSEIETKKALIEQDRDFVRQKLLFEQNRFSILAFFVQAVRFFRLK